MVIGSEGGSFDFAMASPRFYFTGDDENKQTKQEREQQSKKEESKNEARIRRKKFGKVNGLSS